MPKHTIDEHCKYQSGTIVDDHSCILNQTDIKANKNKFYIMQIIKNGSDYVHYIRYGRIGEPGKPSHTSYSDASAAKASFTKQFKAKTGNRWDADPFVKKDGKYFMSEVSYEDELKDVEDDKEATVPDCKLPTRTQNLLMMMSDIDMMKQTLVLLDIDTKKLPLGKIHQKQLKKASELLDDLRKEIDRLIDPKKKDAEVNADTIIELTSKYFTYIPYSCGRKKPPLINSYDKITKFKDVVDDLMNIVVTVKLMTQKVTDIHPLDNLYTELQTSIKPLGKTSKMWEYIKNYVDNTHAPTHSFKLRFVEAYQIQRKDPSKKFEEYKQKLGNTQLLIHGSRMCNWCSILKNDLLIDPTRVGAYITGKMFGYGVYFANSFSKSAQYCGASTSGKSKICLALAEVALGNESKRQTSDYYITEDKLSKTGHDSTWGQGQMTPSTYVTHQGVRIPQRKLTNSNVNTVLRYDEKIVYNKDKFDIKYLVVAEMW